MSTSASRTRRRRSPWPSGCVRLRVMDRFPRAYTFHHSSPSDRDHALSGSPPRGFSTFTTSAPRSASTVASTPPAMRREQSTTRRSLSARAPRGSATAARRALARLGAHVLLHGLHEEAEGLLLGAPRHTHRGMGDGDGAEDPRVLLDQLHLDLHGSPFSGYAGRRASSTYRDTLKNITTRARYQGRRARVKPRSSGSSSATWYHPSLSPHRHVRHRPPGTRRPLRPRPAGVRAQEPAPARPVAGPRHARGQESQRRGPLHDRDHTRDQCPRSRDHSGSRARGRGARPHRSDHGHRGAARHGARFRHAGGSGHRDGGAAGGALPGPARRASRPRPRLRMGKEGGGTGSAVLQAAGRGQEGGVPVLPGLRPLGAGLIFFPLKTQRVLTMILLSRFIPAFHP